MFAGIDGFRLFVEGLFVRARAVDEQRRGVWLAQTSAPIEIAGRGGRERPLSLGLLQRLPDGLKAINPQGCRPAFAYADTIAFETRHRGKKLGCCSFW
jgi:hypothetical protein